jgi:hypothetical protein
VLRQRTSGKLVRSLPVSLSPVLFLLERNAEFILAYFTSTSSTPQARPGDSPHTSAITPADAIHQFYVYDGGEMMKRWSGIFRRVHLRACADSVSKLFLWFPELVSIQCSSRALLAQTQPSAKTEARDLSSCANPPSFRLAWAHPSCLCPLSLNSLLPLLPSLTSPLV